MFCAKNNQNNRLSKLEGLECLVQLEELYVSFNGIKVIEGIETLVSPFPYSILHSLILHTAFTHSSFPHSLYSIPLFSILSFPHSQVNLKTLDLANNRIKRVQNVSHLLQLEDFWVHI